MVDTSKQKGGESFDDDLPYGNQSISPNKRRRDLQRKSDISQLKDLSNRKPKRQESRRKDSQENISWRNDSDSDEERKR